VDERGNVIQRLMTDYRQLSTSVRKRGA
jgi:hypothetical protein